MIAPVSVVTGANSGIGRATAIRLASAGHTVIGTVRNVAKADKLLAAAETAGVTIELAELDVADGDSVRAGFADIFGRVGRVDHLVNNAGVGGNGVVEETTPKQFLDVMNVDLCGVVRCTQAVQVAAPQFMQKPTAWVSRCRKQRMAGLADVPGSIGGWLPCYLSLIYAQAAAPDAGQYLINFRFN